MKYIKTFSEIRNTDIPSVGGKNASLGQMLHDLKKENITVPNGFATTAAAYWHFIDQNNLRSEIKKQMTLVTNIDRIEIGRAHV